MKHVLFEGVDPFIMKGEKIGPEYVYNCPVPDFVVSRIELNNSDKYKHRSSSAEICIVLNGDVKFSTKEVNLPAERGDAIFIEFGEEYTLVSESEAEIYKAAVPE